MKNIRKNIIKKPVSETSSGSHSESDLLRIYAEQYHILTGTSMDGFWAADTDGKLIEVNNTFCRMVGYSEDELLDMTIGDLEMIETPDEVRAHILKIKKYGSDIFESRLKHKDGHVIDIEISVTYYRELDRMLAFLRDITQRRHFNGTLYKAKDTLRAVLDSLPVAIFDLTEDGIVQSIWNPAAEQMLGWTKEEAIGHFLPSVQTEAAKREFKKLREAIKSGQSVIGIDLSRHRKDGTPISYTLYASPLRDPNGIVNGNIAMLVNTTERKRYEEALASSESFLNSIINQSPIPMWISDEKGTLIKINKACLELLHLSEEDVLGKYNIFSDNIVKEQGYMPLVKKVYESGETAKFELKYKSAELKNIKLKHHVFVIIDVTIFPIRDAEGKITNAIIQHVDITRRKQFEEAILESEERYKQLLDSVSDYIYSVKIEDNRPVSTQHGPACMALTGYSPHEFAADPYLWYRMIYEADRDTVAEQTNGILAGKEVRAVEHRIIHKNGTIRWVRNTPVPHHDPDGKFIGYDGIISDITERKQAETALQSAKDYAENLIQTANTIVVGLDLKGFITVFNQAAREITGYTREELKKKNWFETIVPRDRYQEVWTEFERLSDGGPPMRFENPILTKTGEERYIVWRNNLVREQGKVTGIISFGMDITERRKAEEALRENEERLRNAAEAANFGTYSFDLRTGKLYLSQEHLAIYGFPPDTPVVELDEIGIPKIFNIIDKETLVEAVKKANTWTGKDFGIIEVEYRIKCPDGEIRWLRVKGRSSFDEAGQVKKEEGIVQDITARKMAEEALRVSEEKYRDIFERAVEGIFQSSTGGKFLDINPSFAAMLGYDSPKELIESINNIQKQLFVQEEAAAFFEETLKKAGTIFGFEHELYRKDGNKIWISVNARAVRDKDGKVLYFEGIADNITRRKQDEEDKEKLYAQLRQAQKMEALGTFVGGIAHDFNNILSIIVGYATLLQMELDKDNPLRSYADLILSSSEKATGLTQGLLAFGRKQAINLTQLELNDAIKGTKKLLKRLLTEDILLKEKLTKENTSILGDPTQIDQILFNLLTNARDAMPKGGTLLIETSVVELDKEFFNLVGYGKPGKYVLLSVSDTGVGIDKDSREHIFDPFFTTKEVGKGTGLGLSTVYGIVKQHNGYINVYSELNIGTAFHIYFPSAKRMGKEKKKASPKIRSGNEKIIVAEDNEGVRLLIKKILARYGYQIIEAVDGQDAIEKFRRNKKADLVIIDSVMPKKNGREVYNEIIKINPKVKVLFTSGYTRDVILDKGIEEKEFDFISKPVTPKKLLYKVGEMLDRK